MFWHWENRTMEAHRGLPLMPDVLRGGAKSKPIPGPHLVCGLLRTSPNAIVQPATQGDARHPHRRRRARRPDACARGRSEAIAAARRPENALEIVTRRADKEDEIAA